MNRVYGLLESLNSTEYKTIILIAQVLESPHGYKDRTIENKMIFLIKKPSRDFHMPTESINIANQKPRPDSLKSNDSQLSNNTKFS